VYPLRTKYKKENKLGTELNSPYPSLKREGRIHDSRTGKE
jgi:hypothetical protein